jgi:hypothetical protein
MIFAAFISMPPLMYSPSGASILFNVCYFGIDSTAGDTKAESPRPNPAAIVTASPAVNRLELIL